MLLNNSVLYIYNILQNEQTIHKFITLVLYTVAFSKWWKNEAIFIHCKVFIRML